MRVALHPHFQAGPLAIAAVTALAFALVWTALLTYLLPSDAWDGVWYHDLAVGYALQRHGYSEVDLPPGGFQQAFGYPRNSEMSSLWFVIFADRKLIELPSVLAAIPLALGVYCLCERYGKGASVASLLWAVAMVLLPGARLQMRTTYVDLLFAAMTVVAFYFASDPDLRSDGRTIMASVAIGLALGSSRRSAIDHAVLHSAGAGISHLQPRAERHWPDGGTGGGRGARHPGARRRHLHPEYRTPPQPAVAYRHQGRPVPISGYPVVRRIQRKWQARPHRERALGSSQGMITPTRR